MISFVAVNIESSTNRDLVLLTRLWAKAMAWKNLIFLSPSLIDEGIGPNDSHSLDSMDLDHIEEIALTFMEHFDHSNHHWTPSNNLVPSTTTSPVTQISLNDPIKPRLDPIKSHPTQPKRNPKILKKTPPISLLAHNPKSSPYKQCWQSKAQLTSNQMVENNIDLESTFQENELGIDEVLNMDISFKELYSEAKIGQVWVK